MEKNVLQMKYHAAKKEISFKRFQNGKEVGIKSGGALSKYVNMKGKFVLQDFGHTFFNDIAKVFDGIKKVTIHAIMTKLDYEDLVQMIENYNDNPDCQCMFHAVLVKELPDMKIAYEEVKKFGLNAVEVLKTNRRKLFDLDLEKDEVRQSVDNFSKKLAEEIKNIEEKISSLNDNRVSLCFTGVYSAGKSALINALLGYKILPENINSETAKMFRIYSPKKDDTVKIIFELCREDTVLEWNDKERSFEFIKGPVENARKTEIQELINLNKAENKRQDEQIRSLLDCLNKYGEVSSEIIVEYPVALDRENLQFEIFDTPGTDSNYVAHQNVLAEALENQTQSILIFVAKPDGLEGSGNNALLNYLKESEGKNSKTSIDLSRSLFVINKADSQNSDARKTLQQQEIKDQNDGEFTIKLNNKKLFFTSALYGYSAKAIMNGTAKPEDEMNITVGKTMMATPGYPMSHCYRDNRCAESEFATNSMIKRCDEALKEAEQEQNDAKIVSICSGMYALESEIIQYGEKYASAVKAYALIDSVDKALAKLMSQANSLRDGNQEAISLIERNIKELEMIIN